jgi:hypothetical protein
LKSQLSTQFDNTVHLAIDLPTTKPVESLLEFVIAYIEHVPLFLRAAREITQQAHIDEHTRLFFQVAEDFFLKPPEIVAGHIGLDELMDEAYLAHRLIEELNDQFMLHTGIPLIPMDMTSSNLIIHSLIGEPFANELDEAVDYTVRQSLVNNPIYNNEAFKLYVKKHKTDLWSDEKERWPCLTDKLPINLQFSRY